MPVKRTVWAMNGNVELVAYGRGDEHRLDRAAAWLHGFERRFSRFQPGSEVCRLNASAGSPFTVSPQMLGLVSFALSLAELSGGLFDPTVLRQLEAAGYDRSFEQISGRVHGRSPRCSPAVSWRDLTIDKEQRMVTLPPATGIDLGGIGKGWAVDRMSAIVGTPGLINAGGDLFAAGHPHDANAWLVGVEDPYRPERDIAVLAVRDRGVATSTTLRRRWCAGRGWSHHLIDPRTGAPAASDAVQVTVVADTGLLADYHAKVALLKGLHGGLDYLATTDGVEGLLVGDGTVVRTGGLRDYLAGPDAGGTRHGD